MPVAHFVYLVWKSILSQALKVFMEKKIDNFENKLKIASAHNLTEN